jgi:hypothetical protein
METTAARNTWVLATDRGKSCASTSKGRSKEILGLGLLRTKRLAEFRRWVAKIPQRKAAAEKQKPDWLDTHH